MSFPCEAGYLVCLLTLFLFRVDHESAQNEYTVEESFNDNIVKHVTPSSDCSGAEDQLRPAALDERARRSLGEAHPIGDDGRLERRAARVARGRGRGRGPGGSGPYGGTLYTEAQINAALGGTGSVREKDTTGHGTHGLSIAAGDDPSLPGVAPGADLVVVKATREEGTLGFVSTDVINALVFVDEKARELGKPYVANLSLGTIVACHDGRSLEVQAIDELFGPGRGGKAAVVAAGNSSENRSSTRFHHFGGVGYVGLTRTHTLRVPAYTANPGQGDDRVLLDLWYRGRDKLTITVTPP